MPLLAVHMIRAGLAWLVVGLALAVAEAAGPALGAPGLAGMRPIWIHALVVGWLTQLALGVGWWMFPRRRGRDEPRLGWAAVVLNAGLALRLVVEPLAWRGVAPRGAPFLGASALLQLVGLTAFVVALWPRVRARRRAG